MERYVIQSAYKTLQVLLAFAHTPHRFSLTEISSFTGMDKNQVFRALKTLEYAGFVRSEADGSLGLTTLVNSLALGNRQATAVSLPRAASSHMYRLFEQSGESVGLYAYDGERAVLIDVLESAKTIRWTGTVGRHLGLNAGAGPKTILAYLEATERQAFLRKLPSLPKYTPRTITDPKRMQAEIEQSLERGYVRSDGEFDAEARGVGAPIFNAAGRVTGAITVGGPAFRIDDERMQRFGLLALEAANEISRELGFARPLP